MPGEADTIRSGDRTHIVRLAPRPIQRLLESLAMIRRAKWLATTCSLAMLVALLALPATALAQNELFSAEWPQADHRIAYGTGPLQFGYLRLPEGNGPHPVVAFIHGGCYLSMYDIQHAGPAEQAFADEGFAVWSIEYRRVGDDGGGWPNTFLDVAAGLDHLRDLAGPHGLDLDRVYAAGHSAGANFALWAAARSQIAETSDVHAPDPISVQGVLGLAPAPTIGALHSANVCGGVIDGLMGGSPSELPERYAAVSPMRLMPRDVPQRLVVGAHDEVWGPSGRAYFAAAEAGGSSEIALVIAPDSGHFEVIMPTSSTWPIVIEELRKLAGTGGSGR
jgi:acetyl esterase/lipase